MYFLSPNFCLKFSPKFDGILGNSLTNNKEKLEFFWFQEIVKMNTGFSSKLSHFVLLFLKTCQNCYPFFYDFIIEKFYSSN